MKRKIIHIDEEKCNGCGACATACHEGAIGMMNGKAKLLRDDYCDGFGDCLPACPTGAISFTEREAAAYDEQAVLKNKKKLAEQAHERHIEGGCPGHRLMQFSRKENEPSAQETAERESSVRAYEHAPSRLNQWPCQIRLLPATAPCFHGAKLLIAADCTAYAYASMHEKFMKGKITLIGCPKLDDTDYAEKLTDIIRNNDVKSVTIVRMEVPCCGGLQAAAETALKNSGKFIPWNVAVISCDGELLEE